MNANILCDVLILATALVKLIVAVTKLYKIQPAFYCRRNSSSKFYIKRKKRHKRRKPRKRS